MQIKSALVSIGIAMLSAPALFAQEAPKRVEVFLEYSYLRFNPTLPRLNNRSFNGGGGELTFNITHGVGLKAEFLGYGSTTWSTTIDSPIVTPIGTAPVGHYNTQANMFTYLFGPVVKIPISRVNPFGEILFGGSNSNGYANFTRAVDALGGTLNASTSGTQHPFTMAVGGGLDIHVSEHFSFRPVEIDYVLTRFTNPVSTTNNQNHFRYLAGLGYRF